MTQTVLLGFDEQGDPIEYRKLSSRLPGFLAAYPPQEGYQVKIDYLDPIEAKPGLSDLYKSAVAAGQKPENLGLPPVAGNTMIFRARLICPEGRELSSGSALILIQSYKDWEKGETAARQRLLAAMGYGGDMLDQDEAEDQRDQGFEPTSPKITQIRTAEATRGQAPDNPTSNTAQQAVSASEVSDSQNQAAQVKPESDASTQVDVPAADHSVSKSQAAKPRSGADADGIPDSVIRQIEHQAKLKNVTPAEVTTKAEAKTELKRLISL